MPRMLTRFVTSVILILFSSVFLLGLVSDSARAAELKTVDGHVADGGGTPLVGANVTVNMRKPMPDNSIRSTMWYDATDSSGLYVVTFGGMGGADWVAGDTIEIIVTKGTSVTKTVTCTADDQTIDVLWPYVIPEFGSATGLVVAAGAVCVLGLLLASRKKK